MPFVFAQVLHVSTLKNKCNSENIARKSSQSHLTSMHLEMTLLMTHCVYVNELKCAMWSPHVKKTVKSIMYAGRTKKSVIFIGDIEILVQDKTNVLIFVENQEL